MKRLLSCLTACALLLLGTIPCQAIVSPPPPWQVASMEELLSWYGGLSGDVLQECIVTKPTACKGEVVLGPTPCRIDIAFIGGLHVPTGARLTIDNPNLALMGTPPAITVEPGGILHIKRQYALTAQAMPQGGIVVQAGGTLLMEPDVLLPDGVVIDQNPPPNQLPPPNTLPPPNQLPPPNTLPPLIPEAPDGAPPPETPAPEPPPPETPAPEPPDETPTPEAPDEPPPPEETLSIKGEVLKVSAESVLLAIVTLPRVDPALTETIAIERSADAQAWNTEYIFRWDKDALGFTSDETSEFGRMMSKTRNDGSKTDFKYLARLSGAPFYLRVSITKADGSKVVSDAIGLTEPPVGQYPGDEDYEDSGGNRGGGGQGSTDREEQKDTATSRPDSTETNKPQIKTQTSAGTVSVAAPPIPTTALQETVFTAQSAAEQQIVQGAAEQQIVQGAAEQQIVQGATEQQGSIVPEEAVLPASAHPPEQSEQAALAQSKPLGSSARNWLVIAATLALCGAIWIFTTKRKKS